MFLALKMLKNVKNIEIIDLELCLNNSLIIHEENTKEMNV